MMTEESTASAEAIIVPADAGEVLNAFGNVTLVKLRGEQTQSGLAVLLADTPPGGGPPPHVHHFEDEMFLILEGEFQFLANGAWSETYGAGTVVFLPRGSVHSFRNVGETMGRHWIIATPSGFERFFARCADVFAQDGPPDMNKIISISTEHGIEYVPALMPPTE